MHAASLATTATRWCLVLTVCLPLAACAFEEGEVVGGDEVASGEPEDDYLPTPFGRVHRSCLVAVDEDAGFDDLDGALVHADGSRVPLAPCEYPVRPEPEDATASGVALESGARAPASELDTPIPWSNEASWDEQSRAFTNATVSYGAATWRVPGAPARLDGQTIFLFPALQHTHANPALIIQPVLQWGVSGAGGGNYWSIASWMVSASPGGAVLFSPLRRVSAGDTIRGVMSGTDCPSSQQHCNTWTITTTDTTSGASTTLRYYNNKYGLWYLSAGVLETWGMKVCGNYPSGQLTNFHDVTFRSTSGKTLSPSWEGLVHHAGCSKWVWTSATQAHLHYNDPIATDSGAGGSGDGTTGCSYEKVLWPGQTWASANGQYTLNFQGDGNVVLRSPDGVSRWHTNTLNYAGRTASHLKFECSGDLALYDTAGATWWHSNTAGSGGTSFVVQDDCNAVIYDANHVARWSTGTYNCMAPPPPPSLPCGGISSGGTLTTNQSAGRRAA